MKQATLRRIRTGDTGTFGKFQVGDREFVSGELPERGNATGISCIPAGSYICKWLPSPKFGRNVYHVQNVPDRTVIEFHPANHMGDTAKGYHSELNGCIALGGEDGPVRVGEVIQEGLLGSGNAISEFEKLCAGEDIDLVITDEYLEAGAIRPRDGIGGTA